MIKEALQYLVSLGTPTFKEINGQTYSDRELERIIHNPKARGIQMSTLTGLVDYIRAGVDQMAEKMVLQVVDPLEVRLISMLDEERIREELVWVNGKVPQFRYGSYLDTESFLIGLQSKFIPNQDRELLLKFAGTVKNESVATYGDDGVSQKATIKTGIAGSSDAIVPNPVKLCPYRTFLEAGQPESQFVFRMRNDGNGGVECAIFEADGGAWENEAMHNIKSYLQQELAEYPQFIVIS